MREALTPREVRPDVLVAGYTSFELSGGRVQRGLNPPWQGFGGFPNTVRAGGWEEGPFISRVTND